MILAIEGLIPDRRADRRAVSAQNQPAPPLVHPPFYVSAWARTRQDGESADPQPPPAPEPEQAQQEATPELQSDPARADDPPPASAPTPDPTPNLSESIFPGLTNDVIAASRPYVRFVPDTRVPFSIDKNRFGRRR
jgi:hypothetical protein